MAAIMGEAKKTKLRKDDYLRPTSIYNAERCKD